MGPHAVCPICEGLIGLRPASLREAAHGPGTTVVLFCESCATQVKVTLPSSVDGLEGFTADRGSTPRITEFAVGAPRGNLEPEASNPAAWPPGAVVRPTPHLGNSFSAEGTR